MVSAFIAGTQNTYAREVKKKVTASYYGEHAVTSLATHTFFATRSSCSTIVFSFKRQVLHRTALFRIHFTNMQAVFMQKLKIGNADLLALVCTNYRRPVP